MTETIHAPDSSIPPPPATEDGGVMTKDKARAIKERALFDALPADERRKYHGGCGAYIAATDATTSSNAVEKRQRLLLAGPHADPFWLKIEHEGMPIATAISLLRQAKTEWRAVKGTTRSLESVIATVIQRYESAGHVRYVGDRVVRTRDKIADRVERIARGESNGKTGSKGTPRQAVREAIASWAHETFQRRDERLEGLVADCVREVDLVLDTFVNRMRPKSIDKKRLHHACDMLNIPRPKWGRRADDKRAWKNRSRALAAMHPDTLGDDSAKDAFQAIKDAYDVVISYNDSLDLGRTSETEGEG